MAKPYMSPKSFSKEYGFPLHRLRELIAKGEVPGFYSRTYFYVDVQQFLDRLAVASQNNERF